MGGAGDFGVGPDPLDLLARLYQAEVAEAWVALARDLEARGQDRDMRALHGLLFDPADEERGFVYQTLRLDDDGMDVLVTSCPLAEEITALGLPDAVEKVFCAADHVRLGSFNAGMFLERPELLSRGDRRCRFRIGWRGT